MIRSLLCSILFCLGFALPAPTPALAQSVDDIVDIRVLPGWRAADGSHMAALHVTLREGWKTYWRAPGDAGIPPRFDWRGSRNLADVDMIWPTPRITVEYGLTTIGYTGQLVLPMRLTPIRSGRDVTLSGEVEIGVCREVCVPVTLDVSAKLPRTASKRDPLIAASLANQPFSSDEADVSRVACRVSPMQDGLGLRAMIDMPRLGGNETAIIEVSDPKIWVAQPKTHRNGNRIVAETSLHHVEGRSFALDRSGIRVTILAGGQAVDIQGCPAG